MHVYYAAVPSMLDAAPIVVIATGFAGGATGTRIVAHDNTSNHAGDDRGSGAASPASP